MGFKVDYNDKVKKLKNKKIKLCIIILIVIFMIYMLVQSIIRVYKSYNPIISENNELHYDVNEYESIIELLSSYDTSYIRTNNSEDLVIYYVSFDRDLYTNKESNEKHFLGIVFAVAKYEDYKNIKLIDETRNIQIEISCEDQQIIEIKINGDENYYLNHDSEINSNLDSKDITNFSIQSNELKELIENNWSDINITFGTKESTCDGYDIYFDEGIKYKKIGRQVFNLIFTDKYLGEVAGKLNAISTPEEVENNLGKPTFSKDTSLYGYIGENNYLFFDFINKEVSIYPIQKISKEEEEKFKDIISKMNDSSDLKEFTLKLTDLWTDYDEYNYNSNFVNLKYTLRGIALDISSSSIHNGIFIYQNYFGNKNIQDLENVYIKDTDLIFEFESTRGINEQLCRIEQGSFTEEDLMKKMGIDFSVRFKTDSGNYDSPYKSPLFYSRDKDYPDSELSKTISISSYKWFNEYIFVYSVNNEGIFIYDCKTRENTQIYTIEGDILINDISDGIITYNDNEILQMDIE